MLNTTSAKLVLHDLSEGVIVTNNQGVFEYFNPAAEKILGIGMLNKEQEEWPKAYGVYLPDTTTLMPPDQIPLVRAGKGEVVENVELYIKNENLRSGTFISVNGRPLFDESGEKVGAFVIFNDITARKQEEKSKEEIMNLTKQLNSEFMHREGRMAELKKENEDLRCQLGALQTVETPK